MGAGESPAAGSWLAMTGAEVLGVLVLCAGLAMAAVAVPDALFVWPRSAAALRAFEVLPVDTS